MAFIRVSKTETSKLEFHYFASPWKHVDAYDPWTQNLYSYCGNNPVNMVDSTGHRAIQIDGATKNESYAERNRVNQRACRIT